MICIECTNPDIDCLYYKYKSKYIKLTICPQCERVADKYIEYDNVILFIDILLLKPLAYRHLAYNVTEIELLKDLTTGKDYEPPSIQLSSLSQLKCTIVRYKRLLRLITVMILFQVYLTWAYEERKVIHSITMNFILSREIHIQYSFFILKLILEESVLNFSVQFLFHKLFNWGNTKNTNINNGFQRPYSIYVLLVTVLVSSSIKLFPILMLIWPYDNTESSSSIIYGIVFINMIEALKIVTNVNYLSIVLILGFSTVLKDIVSRSITGVIISYCSNYSLCEIKDREYDEMVNQLMNFKDILQSFKENLIN